MSNINKLAEVTITCPVSQPSFAGTNSFNHLNTNTQKTQEKFEGKYRETLHYKGEQR
jgi:hypothetical protein